MQARRISISFHNFWPGFVPETSFFTRALRACFDVSIVPLGQDIQFFSVFGRNFPEEIVRSNALKVWWSGEAQDPKDIVYDLVIGFQANPLLGRRAIRLPLWATYIDWWGKDGPLTAQSLTRPRAFVARPQFCNFIFSNPVSLRNEFFARLNARQRVDSHGKVLNNVGSRAADKMRTLGDYRFTIAFENTLSPGYVTEKLLEPLAAGSIPIYWGASECESDFNPAAFINAARFHSMDDLVEHIVTLDADEEARRAMCEQPIFKGGIPDNVTPAHFARRIEEALDTPSMRGMGRDINPLLAERRSAKGRMRREVVRIRNLLGL